MELQLATPFASIFFVGFVFITIACIALISFFKKINDKKKYIKNGRLYARRSFENEQYMIKQGQKGAEIIKDPITGKYPKIDLYDISWADSSSVIKGDSEIKGASYVKDSFIEGYLIDNCVIKSSKCYGYGGSSCELKDMIVPKGIYRVNLYSEVEEDSEELEDIPEIIDGSPATNLYRCIVDEKYLQKLNVLFHGRINNGLNEILGWKFFQQKIHSYDNPDGFLKDDPNIDDYYGMRQINFIIKNEFQEKLRLLAAENDETPHDVLNKILCDYFSKWEEKNGLIFKLYRKIKVEERKPLDL